MFTYIIEILSKIVISVISSTGYLGVFFCMVIESACIPLPSEIIMPFSGYLVFAGKFNIWIVTLAGALGNLGGSVIAYAVGYYGGRPFVEKYGKYILISHKDLDMADNWFSKYGYEAVLISRVLPIIRTFISLPAGISKMNFAWFSVYSFAGSLPWCFALTYIGMKLGQNWASIGDYFHKFDLVIGAVLIAGIFIWVRRHLSHRSS